MSSLDIKAWLFSSLLIKNFFIICPNFCSTCLFPTCIDLEILCHEPWFAVNL
uniref:Uncharacterized protein n=1 Tax=Rhizophora mucronata TaxID=61149 RepID=A0A2P2QPS7_RHIMU